MDISRTLPSDSACPSIAICVNCRSTPLLFAYPRAPADSLYSYIVLPASLLPERRAIRVCRLPPPPLYRRIRRTIGLRPRGGWRRHPYVLPVVPRRLARPGLDG